jgi:ATP-dependent Clp protease ATP-binding subunit ClpA
MEIMTESFQLTPTAQGIIQLVEEMVQGQSEGQIGLNVWMKALLSGNAGLLQRMAVRFEPATVMESVEMALAANDPGKGYAVSKILKTAGSRAKSLGKNRIGVRDIAAAVLVASGYDLKDPSDPVDRDWLDSGKAAAETVEGASEGDGPPPPDEKTSEKKSEKNVASSSGERASGGAASRFKIKTPEILKQFGRDLTQEAVDGRLPPIIGRGLERQQIGRASCRERV